MTLLLGQMFLCLLAALLIGVIVAWFLRRNIALRREHLVQQEWQSRFRQSELDRDRTVKNLTDEIDRLKARTPAETNVVLADYENLVSKLEGQVMEREDAIGELRSEIQSLRKQLNEVESAAAQRETELLEQHRRESDSLRAQQNDNLRSGEQEIALQHQQEIDRLQKELEQRNETAWAERENALLEEHKKEIVCLKAELELQAKRAAAGTDAGQIDGLNAAIRMRDDAIAVLRNDLAELNQDQVSHSSGQDEQLRIAMDEAMAWQEKYEAVLAELQAQPARTEEVRLLQEPPAATSARRRERTVGDRIGSVLSHPGGPKDQLREIRGIGPVLERRLNDFGIYHFKQIAEFNADDIARLGNELGRHASRITRDDWVKQAQTLNKKYHG